MAGIFESLRKTRNAVFGQIATLLGTGDITDATWDEQVKSFLEFAAAWTPVPDGEGGYELARQVVEQAVAGRKNLRDFRPWTAQRGAVPKSSLDGARDTVLRPPETREGDLVRRFRISAGEQLDAIGLTKRAGGEPEHFVPLANVAFASWLRLAEQLAPAELGSLRK